MEPETSLQIHKILANISNFENLEVVYLLHPLYYAFLTPQEQKLIDAIYDVFLNGIVVEDNKELLKFSKEECLARALPECYYEYLKNDIRTNNSYFQANGNKDVAQMKASVDSVVTVTKEE